MLDTFSMKTVSQQTKLSPHVLRVWEKRYGAVSPQRSASNQRVYSEQDLQKLILLAQLTRRGYRIGQIAELSLKALTELAQRHPVHVAEPPVSGQEKDLVDFYVRCCLEKIRQLDGAGLEETLRQASLELSQRWLVEKVIGPLMQEIGNLWDQGIFRPAHEHLASSLISAFLLHLKAAYSTPDHAPTVVVATTPGQVHEIGALLAAKVAASVGWRVVYLGANLPIEEIAFAVQNSKAQLVAMSLVYPIHSEIFFEELQRFKKLLPKATAMVFGGSSVEAHRKGIETLGGQVIQDLTDFRDYLTTRAEEYFAENPPPSPSSTVEET